MVAGRELGVSVSSWSAPLFVSGAARFILKVRIDLSYYTKQNKNRCTQHITLVQQNEIATHEATSNSEAKMKDVFDAYTNAHAYKSKRRCAANVFAHESARAQIKAIISSPESRMVRVPKLTRVALNLAQRRLRVILIEGGGGCA